MSAMPPRENRSLARGSKSERSVKCSVGLGWLGEGLGAGDGDRSRFSDPDMTGVKIVDRTLSQSISMNGSHAITGERHDRWMMDDR